MKKLIILLMGVLLTSAAYANSEVNCDIYGFYDQLLQMSKGTLGTTIALNMFLIGIEGVARQNIVSCVTGIMGAMLIHSGPEIMIKLVDPNAQCKPKSVMVAQPKKEQSAQPVLVKKEESITKDVSKETQKPKIQGLDEWKY